MSATESILMIVTSHDRIDADHATGLWFEEFAIPYGKFRDAGYTVVVASPRGGDTPIDARSLENYQPTAASETAKAALRGTRKLDATISAQGFAAVFFPGGHGTMFDLPDNPQVQRLVREFAEADKVIASVCHGPACLVGVMLKDGTAFVKGRKVTAFTDSEERAVQLDEAMPFLLESRLREQGATFVPAVDWADNVVVDGKLVTGQNPQSSASAADAVIRLLGSSG
ncbi:MAG: type 1 glutamine amidotransferase domain-containing protein [Thiohalobacteraceae bacterium]